MMKKIVLGALVATTVGLFGASVASAAPMSGAPIAQPAGETSGVTQVWYDRFGRWHPNRGYRRGPVCRTTRVCGPRGCFVRRRCF
jgi:hypothetical protein